MSQVTKRGNIKWRVAQFLEIRWWQQYLGKKEQKTYLKAKQAYWQRILDQLQVEVPVGARVLDAGCGPAGIFIALEQAEVVAVDPLLEAYAEKLSHFNPKDYPWVHFETVMLEHFQAEQAFDYVFCLNAINHVSDLSQGISVLRQATKKGHSLIVSIDSHRWKALKWLFRLLPGDALHPHQHSLQDYENMLGRQGLEILQKQKLKPGWIFDYWVLETRKI